MKKLHVLSILCTSVFSLITFTANAATFNVISGTFEVVPSDGSVLNGVVALNGGGVLDEGVFNGSAADIATDPNASYAGFETTLFLDAPIEFYYSEYGQYDDPGAPLHDAPTINFSNMTADLTSMFAFWNNNEYNVGGIATVNTIDAYSWELSWSHIQADGPFIGTTTYMTMAVSQVPVPAAVWLFGSGLIGLIGVARRNKS